MLLAFSDAKSRRSDEMMRRLAASSVWTQELTVHFRALRFAWAVPADAPMSTF
jgi:hypothetical protein